MKNNKESAHTPKEILTELQSLVTEAEALITGGPDAENSGAVNTLRARFDAVQERCSDVYQDAKKKVAASAKYTDETIRENPYQALAVAAGIGLLVGVLLGRRSK